MTTPEPDTEGALNVQLAEYKELKTEQRTRIGFRDNLVYATIGVAAATGYAAFQQHVIQFFLAVPLACFVLGWMYHSNDVKITQLGAYVRDTLTPQLTALVGYRDVLRWEHEDPTDRRRNQRKCTQLAADLTTFCLPSVIALLLVLRAGTTAGYYRYGFGTWLMLVADTTATLWLAWQFAIHSEVTPPRIRWRRRPSQPQPGPAVPDRRASEPGS